jgi:hypothetical protein
LAFASGKNTKVFFNEFNFTPYFDNVSVPMNVDTAETSTFGSDSKKFIPGLKDATLSAEGFYDGSADAIDEELSAALAVADKLWSVYQNGDSAGSFGYAMKAIETAHSVVSTIDNACRVSVAAQSDGTAAERVVSLHAHGAQADSNWTGSAINNGAASAAGGSAYLHVTAATGTIEVSIRHSSDNFVADDTELVAFTNVTGPTAERKTFSGTVKQYVRGVATIAGGETITFQLGLYRA